MFQKIKDFFHSDKIKKGAQKIEKSSHFIYFGAAAVGSHEIYSAAAGVIVTVIVIGFLLHWHLEG
jgi:hypothetical protein